MAFFSFVGRARNQKSIALFETIQAIEKIQSGAAKLDAAHPLQLTVEDLAKASPLSKSTRRFLGNSHITLALEEPPHHGHFGCAENSQPHGLLTWVIRGTRPPSLLQTVPTLPWHSIP